MLTISTCKIANERRCTRQTAGPLRSDSCLRSKQIAPIEGTVTAASSSIGLPALGLSNHRPHFTVRRWQHDSNSAPPLPSCSYFPSPPPLFSPVNHRTVYIALLLSRSKSWRHYYPRAREVICNHRIATGGDLITARYVSVMDAAE